MNQTAAATQRHIADLEARVTRQSAMVERLSKAGLDSTKAERTLRVLEEALALTHEHIRILLPGGLAMGNSSRP